MKAKSPMARTWTGFAAFANRDVDRRQHRRDVRGALKLPWLPSSDHRDQRHTLQESSLCRRAPAEDSPLLFLGPQDLIAVDVFRCAGHPPSFQGPFTALPWITRS